MTTRSAALILTAVALLGLTACSAASPGAATGSTPTVTTGSPSAGSAATGPSTTASTPAPAGSEPTSTLAPGATAAPATVDTPAEQAAWAALMDPTGEYAAYASYAAVLDRHGTVQPYARIAAAEEQHIAALVRQLERMGIEVPANPYLGKVTAPDDLLAAATAWAEGEVDNVALYDRLIDQVAGDQALTRVFENLRRASQESHLPAFEAAAANGGTTG